jgi:membrane peptidoglycan carboxypeptidase
MIVDADDAERSVGSTAEQGERDRALPMTEQLLPANPTIPHPNAVAPARRRFGRRGERQMLWALRLVCLGLLAWGATIESRTSLLQSTLATKFTRDFAFAVAEGPNDNLRFPRNGPYDERLGYARMPTFIESLKAHQFAVTRQAMMSDDLDTFVGMGGYALYREKGRAGLQLLDRDGTPIYSAAYPEATYENFASVPPIVARTLLFIEDQHLLDADFPQHNPAVDWSRFVVAASGQAEGILDPRLRRGGASTLATQIEKFRHSPAGRTEGFSEKARQMLTATARAYLDGADTTEARQRIVTTYLDATPLSSRPGYGEIIGLGDGLRAWYGTDLRAASRILAAPAESDTQLARKADVYKQILSLLLAERRPSYYLNIDRGALNALADRYLPLLAAAGVIEPELRDAALATQLHFQAEPPAPVPVQFVGRKGADAIRMRLRSLLQVPNLYSLDRLDVTAHTSLDAPAEERVTGVLGRLGNPEEAKALNMVGQNLLGSADPAQVTYSMVLYERGQDANFVRVHADSLDSPFDINSGAKLILGSTAKLRTMVTYLNIMTELHGRLGALKPSELATAASGDDPLTRWAADYLANATDRSLQAMLDAAMLRRYSGDPGETFFTGGGAHVFHNFEKSEDHAVFTVEDAFENSVNLAFVRIMRDIVRYYTVADAARTKDLQAEGQDSVRETYLRRFADQEGREFLNHFYDDFHGRSPDEALALLTSRTSPAPRRLAVVYRSVRPDAAMPEFRAFLAEHLHSLAPDGAAAEKLYASYGIDKYSLQDRGYIAGVHPLELWLAGYLQTHPDASRSEVMNASVNERQEVYGWLFKTSDTRRQDMRIRILMEEDAFDRVLQDWRQQGYPFGHLVPSFASAIGSSGDRPDALAHLMGIILNDGVELPTADIERVQMATGTPYETDMSLSPATPRQVFAPEVAQTVRRALMGVVAHGTGQRVKTAFHAADGSVLVVGGKTGTGDNRFETFSAGGAMTGSRVVDRTATFVFFLGDRFFGTITAFVPGAQAAKYHFTSALAVQLLTSLAPQIEPLINRPPTVARAGD